MNRKNLRLSKVLLVFLIVAINGNVIKFFGNNIFEHRANCEEKASNFHENGLEFDESNFKVQGFELKVFKKGGKFKLLYKDNRTGAQFIFDLTSKDDVKYNSIFFGCPAEDCSGKPHVLEHLLASPVADRLLHKYKSLSPKEFNGITNEFGFYFLINRSIFDLENLEDIFKELKKPTFLTDDEETFKQEVYNKYYKNDTGRLYNEVLTEKSSKEENFYNMHRLRKFNFGGEPEKVSKLKINELKSFYEQYVHPSNMLCSFCCGNDPEKIKEVLNLVQNNFLKYYKKTTIPLDYKLNVDEKNKFIFKTLEGCPELFKAMSSDGKKHSYKYAANIWFGLDNFNIYEKDSLFVKSAILECIDSIRKEIESLGYEVAAIDADEVLKGRLNFKLFGNKKEKFVKHVLEDSARKILKKFSEVLKEFDRYSSKDEVFKTNKLVGDEYFDSIKFQRFDKYRKIYDFYYLNYFAYVMHKNPFSDKVFQIKDGEILDDETNFRTNFMNNIFNVFDKVSNNEIFCIDVFEKSDEKNSNSKENNNENLRDVKLKIKNYKDYGVFRFVENYLLYYVLNPKLKKLGLSYRTLTRAPYVGGFPQIQTNEGSFQSINNFLTKEFYKKIKDFDFNKYDFNKMVVNYAEDLKENLEKFIGCLKVLKEFREMLEQLRNNNACNFSRQDVVLKISKIFNEVEHLVFFNEKQDYLDYKNNEESFKKTYVNYLDNYLNNDEQYERFYSEIFKYFDYKINIFKKLISEFKAKLEDCANLNSKEVLKSIKSCEFQK